MDLSHLNHVVLVMTSIFEQAVLKSGANPLQSGGYLALYRVRGNYPLLLHAICNPPEEFAGILAFHAFERGRLLATRKNVLLSSNWEAYCAGAILASPLCISFTSTLPNNVTEACSVALASHMLKDFDDPHIVEKILRASSHRTLANELLEGVSSVSANA